MAQQRSIELRVGIFVVVCLVVVTGLVLRFGKYSRGLENAYRITVVFSSVAGIVPDASVLYAGIPVGVVQQIRLREDGAMRVAIDLAIHEGVVIREDAEVSINTSGLLGDKYVDIQPGSATARPLVDGDIVEGRTSVDLTEAITHVKEVLQRAAGTIERVDLALQRLDETVLSRTTLDHVSSTLANADEASTNAVVLVASLRDLVGEQRSEITKVLQNFQSATSNLNSTTERVDLLVQDNQDEVAQTLSNMVASTERLDGLLAGLQRGEGTAGRLLVDPTLHDEVVRLVQNWRRYGLLHKEGTARASQRDRRGTVPGPARPAKETAGTIEFGTDMTK